MPLSITLCVYFCRSVLVRSSYELRLFMGQLEQLLPMYALSVKLKRGANGQIDTKSRVTMLVERVICAFGENILT